MFACGTFVDKNPDRHMPGKGAYQSAPRNGVGILGDIEGVRKMSLTCWGTPPTWGYPH